MAALYLKFSLTSFFFFKPLHVIYIFISFLDFCHEMSGSLADPNVGLGARVGPTRDAFRGGLLSKWTGISFGVSRILLGPTETDSGDWEDDDHIFFLPFLCIRVQIFVACFVRTRPRPLFHRSLARGYGYFVFPLSSSGWKLSKAQRKLENQALEEVNRMLLFTELVPKYHAYRS